MTHAEVAPLLTVSGLSVEYQLGHSLPPLRANDDVSIEIRKGETLGLVGESGSGKSTLGDAILGFVRPKTGRILFNGEDITHAPARRRRELTRGIQVVFQNPYGSLNPARTVGQILIEPLAAHRIAEGDAARSIALQWLDTVGLSPDSFDRYPGDFSGGQRQRVAIARALILEPDLVVCDEAVSALDLSIQAQILNLLMELQGRLGISYLFISHNIAVVEHVSDRIVVMHNGRVVESGDSESVIHRPQDPYTQALIAAAPVPDPSKRLKWQDAVTTR